MSTGVKKRAIVLGAGPSGLAAALGLIKSGDYEVHVYQMGWRAGGKCATGREVPSGRMRQNGSHYLFGCYHNAFALIREAHHVLDSQPRPEQGFGSVEEDFVARNLLVGAEGYLRPDAADGLDRWYRYLPQNMAVPGEGSKYPTPFDYLLVGGQLVIGTAIDLVNALRSDADDNESFDGVRWCLKLLPVAPFDTTTYSKVVRGILTPFRWLFNLVAYAVLGFWVGTFRVATRFLLSPETLAIPGEIWRKYRARYLAALQRFAETARSRALKQNPNTSKAFQRLIVLFEICSAVLVGFFEDELFRPGGFEKIDDEDLRVWLARHGATSRAVDSSLVTTWYDATLAYKFGEQNNARCSAGVALNAILRSLLTYKGAFAYQMLAEVGDSFIAPTVRALELLGVQFHFYHRVCEIAVDASAGVVERVVLGLQVANPPLGAQLIDFEYGPDAARKMRRAWPSVAGEPTAAAASPAFDSYYSVMPRSFRTLSRRPDGAASLSGDADVFDVVVSALPLGVLEDVLVDLNKVPARHFSHTWRDTFDNVQFAESQAVRMWFNESLTDLGWAQDPPILSGNDWPHSTWEDNSQAVAIHDFPRTRASDLRTIGTVFGPLETGQRNVRSAEHAAAQLEIAEQRAQAFLEQTLLKLWPAMHAAGQPFSLDWNAFIDLEGRTGPARFAFQHVVANVGPSDSYVVTYPRTLRYRPRQDESGFRNLYLAGDWTRNGVEAGTVEGAVISGLKAARAISGYPETIVGGDDFDRGTVIG